MTGPVLSLQLSTIHEANDRLRPNAIEVIEPLPFSFVYCLFFWRLFSLSLGRVGTARGEEERGEEEVRHSWRCCAAAVGLRVHLRQRLDLDGRPSSFAPKSLSPSFL